jgi:hypothetical protein
MTTSIPSSRKIAPYANGLEIAYASATTLTVSAGSCSDDANAWDIINNSAVTIDAAVVGLNGIDTGTLGASTLYYIYEIGSSLGSTLVGSIISTSATSPILPARYDLKKLIGYIYTDGSSHFVNQRIFGKGRVRKCVYDTAVSVLSGGSATFVAVDLSAAVPALDKVDVEFIASITPNTAGNVGYIRPAGSTATVVPALSGCVAAKAQLGMINSLTAIASGVAKIEYKTSEASDTFALTVYSYTYHI